MSNQQVAVLNPVELTIAESCKALITPEEMTNLECLAELCHAEARNFGIGVQRIEVREYPYEENEILFLVRLDIEEGERVNDFLTDFTPPSENWFTSRDASFAADRFHIFIIGRARE
ncbi:MAG: hypothetical protein NT023_05045 [Armatimonadetes bacterium]|nr:hypothetical protein [Armatimonadota bacterium]